MKPSFRSLFVRSTAALFLASSTVAQETYHGDFWKLLQDLSIEFKIFTDSNGESSPGISYDIERSVIEGRVDLEFMARGNVAFERDFNPVDFLETRLSVAYDGSHELSEPQGTGTDPNDLELIAGDLLHFNLALQAGLESNQSFTEKQYTYGASLDAWAKISERKTVWWNVFDYPAAALRALSGYEDEGFQPVQGFFPKASYGLPAISLGIDQVNVDENDPRAAAGDTSDFARFRFEASMRSPVMILGDEEIFLSADYRLFRELGASDAIEAADLDSFDFAGLALFDARGFFVRYTTGMLPFDNEDAQAYELGWSFNGGAFL
ncbi:MAG: hypothetical protein ABL998_01385 [Planctomycetota bacterium]